MELQTKNKLKSNVKRFFQKAAIKSLVCVCLFSGCVILKQQTAESSVAVWNMVSESVTGGVNYQNAMEGIGAAIREKESVFPVFQEMIEEMFFLSDAKETTETVVPVVNAADLSIELLSFEMSDAELQDDTTDEIFLLPGATANTSISFPHTTPLYGVVTSPFGYRVHPILQTKSFHTGLDIAGAMGDRIGAFADGTVSDVGVNQVYGNYVLVSHQDGYSSFYGHASKILVREGEQVSIGQSIAEVGTTGLSTGPHLHFEVRKNKTRLDPALFIIPNP